MTHNGKIGMLGTKLKKYSGIYEKYLARDLVFTKFDRTQPHYRGNPGV